MIKWVHRRLDGTKEGTVRAEDYIIFYGKGNENHQLGTGDFVHHRTVTAVTTAGVVYDMMSHIFREVTGVLSF